MEVHDFYLFCRTEVQLYASVAFVVACKLEELDSPEIEDFVYLTNNAYSHGQLVVAEQELLTSIDFNLHRPNPFFFLRYFYRVSYKYSITLDPLSIQPPVQTVVSSLHPLLRFSINQ